MTDALAMIQRLCIMGVIIMFGLVGLGLLREIEQNTRPPEPIQIETETTTR